MCLTQKLTGKGQQSLADHNRAVTLARGKLNMRIDQPVATYTFNSTNTRSNTSAAQQAAGTNMPLANANAAPTQTPSKAQVSGSSLNASLKKLVQTIDPSAMSRNDAKALADVLLKAGEFELSSVFISHSLVLVPEGASYRTATKDDAIMQEKFDMFAAIKSNIEFKKSQNLDYQNDLAALSFLDKFKMMASTPSINTYA